MKTKFSTRWKPDTIHQIICSEIHHNINAQVQSVSSSTTTYFYLASPTIIRSWGHLHERPSIRRQIVTAPFQVYTFSFNTFLCINPLKTKRRPSSYRAVNTFHLCYKNQSVYTVSGTSRCLFSDKYKTTKYSVGRTYSCWMLNCWCIT